MFQVLPLLLTVASRSGSGLNYLTESEDDETDASSDELDDDDSLFFSDEETGFEREGPPESRGINKTAQLGVISIHFFLFFFFKKNTILNLI